MWVCVFSKKESAEMRIREIIQLVGVGFLVGNTDFKTFSIPVLKLGH